MKINLNNYLISNKQYVEYLLKKNGLSNEDYKSFIFINSNENTNTTLLPYLYTLSKISEIDYYYFKMFYFNYIEKSGIGEDYAYNLDYDKSGFIKYISQDIVLTITLIIAAQYYFL
jgi:hypothetical protein